jgi:hypothetical protein
LVPMFGDQQTNPTFGKWKVILVVINYAQKWKPIYYCYMYHDSVPYTFQY